MRVKVSGWPRRMERGGGVGRYSGGYEVLLCGAGTSVERGENYAAVLNGI